MADWMTRKEAAAYLTSIGCPVSPKTLANRASNSNAGDGPPFVSSGWRSIRYAQADLDLWASFKRQVCGDSLSKIPINPDQARK